MSDVQSILAEFSYEVGTAFVVRPTTFRTEIAAKQLAQALLDARTEAVALRAGIAKAQSWSDAMDCKVRDVTDDYVTLAERSNAHIAGLNARIAALEAGPTDDQLDVALTELNYYAEGVDPAFGLPLYNKHRSVMRGIIRAALTHQENT